MNTPLQISVIICTYNRAAYIPEALKSLSEQTLSKDAFEVIVVNNNSTDDTEEVCKNCIARFANTRISYTNELNQGASFARNTGAQLAQSPLLCLSLIHI